MEPGPPVPAKEPVKESPHPLIPADAGIQTLPNGPDFQWAKPGSPRPRGRTVQQSPTFGNSLTRSKAGIVQNDGAWNGPGSRPGQGWYGPGSSPGQGLVRGRYGGTDKPR